MSMKRIEWENSPSTSTPINADNLNEMQDNIEEAIITTQGEELYSNTSGTLSDITLSSSSEDYYYLDIVYSRDLNFGYITQRVYNPNGKLVNLCSIDGSTSNYIGISGGIISISGTNVTFINGKSVAIENRGEGQPLYWGGWADDNEISIYAIYGYKKIADE